MHYLFEGCRYNLADKKGRCIKCGLPEPPIFQQDYLDSYCFDVSKATELSDNAVNSLIRRKAYAVVS